MKRDQDHRAGDHAGRAAPPLGGQRQRQRQKRQERHRQRARQAGIEFRLQDTLGDQRVGPAHFLGQFRNGKFGLVAAPGPQRLAGAQDLMILEVIEA